MNRRGVRECTNECCGGATLLLVAAFIECGSATL